MRGRALEFLKKIPLFRATPAANHKLIEHLARQPLFKNAPAKVLAEIAGRIKIHHLEKDEVMLNAGDPSQSLFILRSGWVKVVGQDDSGQEVILNHVGPGQIIGEMALIDKKPRSSSVVVLRATEVMEIEYDVILAMLDQYPVLGKLLLQEMFNRMRFANAYVEQAIGWCRQITVGNYDLVQDQVEQTQSTVVDMTQPDHARASAFLSVFFKMVEDVRERELSLKQELQRLTIQIDEAKRQRAVKELTDSEFFEALQHAAQKIREKRAARLKERSEQRHDEG